MYKIVNGRGTGKTKALLVKAADEGAIVICRDPDAMKTRALMYGLYDLRIMGYDGFEEARALSEVYIHDVDDFLDWYYAGAVKGYTMTYEP